MWESLQTISVASGYICQGAFITIGTVVIAILLGLSIGIPMAVGLVYGPFWLKLIIKFYVWIFRGIPILVLLYLIYFGLSYQLQNIEFQLFGEIYSINIDIHPFAASCIVLGLVSGAYQSQIFRGCIESVPSGQLKAAKALGMSTLSGIRTIVIPQVLRLALPAWSNEYSILLKDSALVSVLGTMEIMFRIKAISTRTAEYTAFYAFAAFLYFFITFIGVRFLKYIENKYRIPGSLDR